MDYLFYELGLNLIPIDTKTRSFNPLLNPWKESPIPNMTFERWKKKGLFKKGKNRPNYGIVAGKIHRGKGKGKILKDVDMGFNIDKGTTFVPLFVDPKNEYELLSSIYQAKSMEEPHDSQLGDSNSPI